MGVLFLPGVAGGITDTELPAEIANGGIGFGLANCLHDLLFGEFRPLHRSTPFVEDHHSRHRTRVSTCRFFQGNVTHTHIIDRAQSNAMHC